MGSNYPKEWLEGLELLTVCASPLIMLTITNLQTVLSSLMHFASLKPGRKLQAYLDLSPNDT